MKRWLPIALALSMLAGCTTGAVAPPSVGIHALGAGEAFTLRPGEAATLPDATRVRFVEVINDSRCRPDVRCVWAGRADVVLELERVAGNLQRMTIRTDASEPVPVGAWRLTLLALGFDTPPAATLRIDPR